MRYCKFCNQQLDILIYDYPLVGRCENCNLLSTFVEGQLVKTTINIYVNDVWYIICENYINNKTIIENPDSHKKLTIDCIFNINLNQLKSKLEKILVFS